MTEQATLGGGCFWCLEAAFVELNGVEKVESGYSAGMTPNPSYRDVCGGRTGHAEVVQISFDPAVISYRELLEVFFTIHDPTTLNRQGADFGTQYRSIILTHSPEQEAIAKQVIGEIESCGVFPNAIVTQIEPQTRFFKAEDYHQNYFRDNPSQGYCLAVISPKVAKLRKRFGSKLKAPA